MRYFRALIPTSIAMIAFAGNSLLCRLALRDGHIDAASFTLIRLLSGAGTLWLVVLLRRSSRGGSGSWLSAAYLFIYAAGFSLAYTSLPAATGAILLFGAVQATMIGTGAWRGERLHRRQIGGLLLALMGLVVLLAPGLSAPPPYASVLMLSAGAAWGLYSLRGRGGGDPIPVTAGNFLRTLPLVAAMSVLSLHASTADRAGVLYGVASGALASGAGYAIWYSALPALTSTGAAVVQLSVPVIAALGGYVFLHEAITVRLAFAAAAIIGGIAVVIVNPRRG